MDNEELRRQIEEAMDAVRVPGVNWSMALAVNMLRELDARIPGFRDAVHARVQRGADRFAASDDPDDRDDAPSLQELADSWVFTEASANGPETR